MTVCHHLDGGWNKNCKSNSPFTSFSADNGNVITKYGDYIVRLDLEALKQAKKVNQVETEILELPDILKAIDDAPGFSERLKSSIEVGQNVTTKYWLEGLFQPDLSQWRNHESEATARK